MNNNESTSLSMRQYRAYVDTKNNTHKQQVLATCVLHYVSSSQVNRPLSKVQSCVGELTVMRISSGKLKLEVDKTFCACKTIAKALNYFEHTPHPQILRVIDLPRLDGSRSIVSIDLLPAEINTLIKVQAIAEIISRKLQRNPRRFAIFTNRGEYEQ